MGPTALGLKCNILIGTLDLCNCNKIDDHRFSKICGGLFVDAGLVLVIIGILLSY